jgi:D-alanyl-lipoteichoic acid acyltransferase DltB (MBOAT superfamily)
MKESTRNALIDNLYCFIVDIDGASLFLQELSLLNIPLTDDEILMKEVIEESIEDVPPWAGVVLLGGDSVDGIKLPENFNWPYLSSNISEFWRRWHISLGRWLFDYIYAPLGGSKKGSLSASRNLLITFGVSGLWHGASYHFVVWGLWHGFLVVMHRAWKAWAHPRSIYIHRIFSIILTYLLVNLGWVFFCVEFSQGLKIFSRLFKFWGIS